METAYHAAESAAKLCAALADAPGPAKALDALIAETFCPRLPVEAGESPAEPRWLVDGRPLAEAELPYWSGDLAAATSWLRQRLPGWAWRLRHGRFRPGGPARPFASFHEPASGDAVIGPACHTEILALLAAAACVETLPLRRFHAAGLYLLQTPDRGQRPVRREQRLPVAGWLRLDPAGAAEALLRSRCADGSLVDEARTGRYRVPMTGLVVADWQDGPQEAYRQVAGGREGPCTLLVRTGSTAPGAQPDGGLFFVRSDSG